MLKAQDIGTPPERFISSGYDELGDDSPLFYLNTQFPAVANGTVISLSFCYNLSGSIETTTYRATIGFYHMVGTNYSLVDSVSLSRSGGPVSRCENITIPPIEVQESDVIGVCGGPSVGQINFIVNSMGHDQLQRDGSESGELFCREVGDVPVSLPSEVLNEVNGLIMQIAGTFGECRH